jgi:hypothetical protein
VGATSPDRVPPTDGDGASELDRGGGGLGSCKSLRGCPQRRGVCRCIIAFWGLFRIIEHAYTATHAPPEVVRLANVPAVCCMQKIRYPAAHADVRS